MKNGNQNIVLLFASFLLLMLAAATYAPVWYDDAGHFIVVQELIDEGTACYPIAPNWGECDPNSPFITMGPALNYPLASWMRIAGRSMVSARMFMVLLGLQALLAFWLLSRQLVQTRKTFWAIALVVGNIQFITYGAEVLGEVPMLGWLFLGLAFQLSWWKHGRSASLLLATLAYVLAILTKEYIAGPLAFSMIAWGLIGLTKRKSAKVLGLVAQALLITVALLTYHYCQAGSWSGMLTWLEERSSYGSEFLSLGLGESFRFLLFKPLVLLGTLALFVKVGLRRASSDMLICAVHCSHLAFFLCSSGYDRFGFQLLFIPAIYLSEFIAVIWTRFCRKGSLPFLRKAAFILLFAAIFSQQTLPSLAAKAFSPHSPNHREIAAIDLLQTYRGNRMFTFDQQLIPFLPAGFHFRLSSTIPSNAQNCDLLALKSDEWFLAGVYARTEFDNCISWENLTAVDSTGSSEDRYVLFQTKNK